MAKKTIFQPIDYNAVKNLGIEDSEEFDVWTGSTVETVLHTESSDKRRELIKILKEETQTDLQGLKKGFILPSCDVSVDRLKEALREHKIYVTNDYEKADFIITHDDIYEKDNGSHFRTKKMITCLNNMYMTDDSSLGLVQSNPLLYTDKLSETYSMHSYDVESAPYDLNLISGLTITLCDLINSNEMSVINTETVLRSSNNVQMLTEELVEDLTRMFQASGDDGQMAGTMLVTIDPLSEPALLWKLVQSCQSDLDYSFTRSKDIQHWKNRINYDILKWLSAEDAIKYFIKEETLTSKSFRIIEPLCRQEIYIQNREMYTFKVQLKPEYSKYLTNTI